MNTKNKINVDDFFCKFFDIKKESLKKIKRGKNFEWDSMKHVDLIITLEKTFNLKIDTKKISKIENYNDIIDVIKKK